MSTTVDADLLVHEDGTLTVHGRTIRGLVLEAESIEELCSELFRLVPRLLRTNHGLTDEEMGKVNVRMTILDDDEMRRLGEGE